ncbi:MAG TPA: hypothetical protein VK925_09280 [Jiangellaceae bacterium]|nr:hypothetical protein [Jiangellaceae bacterium]
MNTYTDHEALLIHAGRAAELRQAAERARLAKSLRGRAHPGRAAAPWWQRLRRFRFTGTRRARPA